MGIEYIVYQTDGKLGGSTTCTLYIQWRCFVEKETYQEDDTRSGMGAWVLCCSKIKCQAGSTYIKVILLGIQHINMIVHGVAGHKREML